MVFHDIAPAARVHLLVIPRAHIATINNLTPHDLPLGESSRAAADDDDNDDGDDRSVDCRYHCM